jgi:carbon monoxide dehydrogenase subunit G
VSSSNGSFESLTTFAEPSGKAIVPCGKANIGGEINWTANLTQGLQIRQLGAAALGKVSRA